MSESETNEPSAASEPAAKSEPSSASPEGDVAFAEAEVAAPEAQADKSEPDPLQVAKAEAQKYREQLLRTAADFDNFRKRTRREIDDAARKGKEQSLKELLPVFDNLERAVVTAENAPDVKSVLEGLRMVLRQFTSTLEKMNIRRIPTVGSPFDPSLHEAIQHVESKEHAAGVVAAEVQAGYQIGDFLLRAAMVVVSKGGPEGEAAAGDPPAEA